MLIAYPIFYVLIIFGGGALIAAAVLAAERYLQRRALRIAVEARIQALRVYNEKAAPVYRAMFPSAELAARAERRYPLLDTDVPTVYAVEYGDGGGI